MSNIIPQKTKKGIVWKLVNLWYIPILLPMSPLALLYTGLSVKNNRWIRISVLAFAIMTLALVLIIKFKMIGLGTGLSVVTWLFTVIYTLATASDFLARLEVKQDETEVFNIATERINSDPVLSQNKLAQDFIKDLHKWHREVESLTMKKDIEELIEISVIVLKRNNKDSERFFLRYNETITKMLQKYDEIENTRLNTVEMRESMDNIEKTLDKIVVAFKNEASSMYKNDMRDMNAETAAFLQDLRNRGLLENE